MAKVQSVYFGVSPDSYDRGDQPVCALNAHGVFVEMHRGAEENDLYYRVGFLTGLSIKWVDVQNGKPPASFGPGSNPSVALTDDDMVIEVHDNGSGKIFYSVRAPMKIHRNTIMLSAATAAEIGTGDGKSSDPSVAFNKSGVLEVHRSGDGLQFRVGVLSTSQKIIVWPAASQPLVNSGSNPSVAINRSGTVVAVYEDDGKLYYVTGGANGFHWNSPVTGGVLYETGNHPSVALTNDGWVYEVHQSETESCSQRVGRLSQDGKTIDWKAWLERGDDPRFSYQFDDGQRPQVATNGVIAAQVHLADVGGKTLFTTASAVFDRGNWMQDHLEDLKNKRLGQLVMSGSHDAGQYTDEVGTKETRTQTLKIYGQLADGVRYFDLRPIRKDGQIRIHHDIQTGVLLQEVLDDVRAFMEMHNELVILKFSHYGNKDDSGSWDQAAFNQMVTQLQDPSRGLAGWLRTDTSARIGTLPLKKFISDTRGTVLVVADTDIDRSGNPDYVSTPPPAGIFRYRDWTAPSPQEGDLRVFDIFGDTDRFEKMVRGTHPDPHGVTKRNGKPLPQGQYPKFDYYDGYCRNPDGQTPVPCDLFLLSWTLTPALPTAIDNAAKLSTMANKRLVDELTDHPDVGTKMFNVLYTDVVQASRSSDVAFLRNGLLPPPAP